MKAFKNTYEKKMGSGYVEEKCLENREVKALEPDRSEVKS